jgi:hypothetical protein
VSFSGAALRSYAMGLASQFQILLVVIMMGTKQGTISAAHAYAMTRPAIIPAGSWPRRMSAGIAAGYCGESTVEAFLKRVGKEYPRPRVKEGKHQLWLRDDLDRAIAPDIVPGDLAEDL